MRIVMTRGLPGSGKSTWAKEFLAQQNERWYRWNNDDFCEMLTGVRFGRVNGKFLGQRRKGFILGAVRAGTNIILDNTNLNPYTTTEVEIVLEELRVECEIENKFFPISLVDAIERDSRRDRPVGPDVILGMHSKWIDKWPQLKVE